MVPIDRPLKALGMLAGPFGDAYRSATVERLKQECLPLKQADAPRVRITLILNVEEHADGFLLVEATLDPEMAPLEPDTRELAECLVRTHRNLFLQVEGTSGGRRFRIPWPIRI